MITTSAPMRTTGNMTNKDDLGLGSGAAPRCRYASLWHFCALLMFASCIGLAPQIAFAAETSCPIDAFDGHYVCTEPQPVAPGGALPGQADGDGFVYGVCDEHSASVAREVIWCAVVGGTWVTGPYAGCENRSWPNEGVIVPWAVDFVQRAHAPCSMNYSDTGWGIQSTSWDCWAGGPQYKNGILWQDHRRIDFSGTSQNSYNGACDVAWAEQVYALKDREVKCPAGYSTTTIPPSNDLICYRPEPPCCKAPHEPPSIVGDPISAGSGAVLEEHVDYPSTAAGGIELRRYYNSQGYYRERGYPEDPADSTYWRLTYDARLFPVAGSSSVIASVRRPNGSIKYFSPAGAEINNTDGAGARLEKLVDGSGNTTGWRYTSQSDTVELYDAAGRLLSITTLHGVAQTLAYDGQGRLAAVSDSYGRELAFAYDTVARTTTITAPGNHDYIYGYDEAQPHVGYVSRQRNTRVRVQRAGADRWSGPSTRTHRHRG